MRQKNILKDLCAGEAPKAIMADYRITERAFRLDCEIIRSAFGAESNMQAAYIFGVMSK